MSQFENLSEAGRKIVENYISEKSNILLSSKKKMELMVSLYAMMDGANPEVLNILSDSLKILSDYLSKEDIDILRAEYPAVMNYCFEKRDPFNEAMYYVDKNGYTNKMLPKSLLELCQQLASPNKGDDVFLPYAGFAQIALLMPEANYSGFELNADRWALSQMMLHASGIPSAIMLTGDMHMSLPKEKLYNYIFSMPPFATGREERGVVDNIYELATKHLAEKGALCCILPETFCYSASGWFEVRKILLDYPDQFSTIVITLPQLPNMFSSTNLCVFCLVKDGNGDVMLMDASRNDAFMVMHDPDYYEDWYINVDSIIATLKHGSMDYCWFGKAELLSDSVDLTPSRYLVKNILPEPNTRKGEVRYRIGDLIELVSTTHVDMGETKHPLLGMKELSDNYLNCDIAYSAVPWKKPQSARALTENCLLVGFIGGKFKVGKTIDLSEELYVTLRPEIIPFRLKSKEVSEEFLLRSFMLNDNLREQAKMLSTGVTISRLKKQDLLDLVIVVPSKEEQSRLASQDTKSTISEAEQKLKDIYEEFRRDMHMKKHAIGQTIFNLNNWWKILQRARREGNGVIEDNAVIGRNQKVSVKEIHDNIQQIIGQLQQQISKFDRGNGLVPENISLTDFIEDYIEKHKSPLFRFDYDAASHYHIIDNIGAEEVYDEKGNIIGFTGGKTEECTFEYAVFPPEALTIIFDNIVSNACCHGFDGREDEPNRNIIKIELSTEGTDHIISISNNGKPVSEIVTEDYVFTYNSSTQNGKNHFGIGGYEVKRLMKEFDGDAEFISRPEDRFPVVYRLVFHNTNIQSIDIDFSTMV